MAAAKVYHINIHLLIITWHESIEIMLYVNACILYRKKISQARSEKAHENDNISSLRREITSIWNISVYTCICQIVLGNNKLTSSNLNSWRKANVGYLSAARGDAEWYMYLRVIWATTCVAIACHTLLTCVIAVVYKVWSRSKLPINHVDK